MKPDSASPFRLLVEGKDDLHTVIHLLRRHQIDYDHPRPDYPYIHATEGYAELLETMPVSAKTHHKLGVLIDADCDLKQRWSSIKDRLHNVGVNVPAVPPATGLVTAGISEDKKIGVWLMPNNVDSGMLEDFLAQLVPPGDSRWHHAENATTEAKSLGAPFEHGHFAKARIHTWLAWQKEPGQPFGTALTAAYFRHDSEVAMAFVNWFKRLFF